MSKLTINDPISPEVLKLLEKLSSSRQQVADNLLELELEKVNMLVAARSIDQKKAEIFSSELELRGLDPDTRVIVDGKTGAISLETPATVTAAGDEPGEANV